MENLPVCRKPQQLELIMKGCNGGRANKENVQPKSFLDMLSYKGVSRSNVAGYLNDKRGQEKGSVYGERITDGINNMYQQLQQATRVRNVFKGL